MKRTGFTLIELMVVIAVIAILAAILYPVYASVRQRALAARCISNLKSIGYGMMMYRDDYDGLSVPMALPDITVNASGIFVAPDAICSYPVWSWWELLDPYTKSDEIYVHQKKKAKQPCAWNKVQWAGYIGGEGMARGDWTKARACDYALNVVVHSRIGPSDDFIDEFYPTATFRPDFDAWVNGGSWTDPNTGVVSTYSQTFYERPPYNGDGSFKGWSATLNETDVNFPMQLISCMDGTGTYVEPGAAGIWGAGGRTGYGQTCLAGTANNFRTPHQGAANILCFDGHVERLKRSAKWDIGERRAVIWTNSPFADGGLWNRYGTADSADDVYYTNIVPYRHHGVSITWYPSMETIFEVDGTYGEYNTSGRPAGPTITNTPVDRYALYNSRPSSRWYGQAYPHPYEPQ